MRKIRVGFSRPKHMLLPLFSWAIQLYEGTPYSHSYIRWQTKWNTWLCYQASGTMVNFAGQSAFDGHIKIISEYEIEVSDVQFDSLMEFCTRFVGEPYGMMDVIKVVLADMDIKLKGDGDKKQYCVELVFRALGLLKLIDLTTDPDRVKLKQVENYLSKSNGSWTRIA